MAELLSLRGKITTTEKRKPANISVAFKKIQTGTDLSDTSTRNKKSQPSSNEKVFETRLSLKPNQPSNQLHQSIPTIAGGTYTDPSSSNSIKNRNPKLARFGELIMDRLIDVELIWRNLSYKIDRTECWPFASAASSSRPMSSWRTSKKPRTKYIFKNLTGRVRSGQLVGIMGPSGAGKSTLLECLAGQRKSGLSGDIVVTDERHMKIALISQQDHHLRQLTVRESLVYASRIKNYSHEKNKNPLSDPMDVFGDTASALVSPAYDVMSVISATNRSTDGVDTDEAEHMITSHHTNGSSLVTSPMIGSSDLESSSTAVQILPKGEASRSKKSKYTYHEQLAINVIKQLGLESCADVKLQNCSGGQMKRVSIAVELISKPHILLLDEPTSGLDSSSCYQCVQLLSRLTQTSAQSIAILATIHQPSARVLDIFDHLYILSHDGRCIYNGPTSHLLPYLSKMGLECPTYHNPADYVTEVASGDYGEDSLQKLVAEQRARSLEHDTNNSASSADSGAISVIKSKQRRHTFPVFLHTWLLLSRTFLTILREPFLTSLRLILHIIVGITVAALYGVDIGKEAGCIKVPDIRNFNQARIEQMKQESLISENVAFLFFSMLFILFSSMMPTALTFPVEMSVFLRERTNGWYSAGSYFVAKTLADAPFQILFPVLYIVIVYYWTGQVNDPWRIGAFIGIAILLAFICQSIGLLIGAIFVDCLDAAVFVAPLSAIPVMLFSGFFVRIQTMPSFLQPVSYLSYLRFAFESLLISIYGFNRCPSSIQSNSIYSWQRSYLHDRNSDHEGNSTSSIYVTDGTKSPNNLTEVTNSTTPAPDTEGSFLLGAVSHPFSMFDFGAPPVVYANPETDGAGNASNPFGVHKSAQYSGYNRFDSAGGPSLVMGQFDLNDDMLHKNVLILLFFVFFLRLLGYLVLLYKSNKKK